MVVKKLQKNFKDAGGKGKPCWGEATVCWAESDDDARRRAYEIWPISANTVQLNADLPTPTHFEQLGEIINEDIVAEKMVCSNDPQKFIDEVKIYIEAGFDYVCINNIGKDQ